MNLVTWLAPWASGTTAQRIELPSLATIPDSDQRLFLRAYLRSNIDKDQDIARHTVYSTDLARIFLMSAPSSAQHSPARARERPPGERAGSKPLGRTVRRQAALAAEWLAAVASSSNAVEMSRMLMTPIKL